MRDARGKINNDERMIWIMQRQGIQIDETARITREDKPRLEQLQV